MLQCPSSTPGCTDEPFQCLRSVCGASALTPFNCHFDNQLRLDRYSVIAIRFGVFSNKIESRKIQSKRGDRNGVIGGSEVAAEISQLRKRFIVCHFDSVRLVEPLWSCVIGFKSATGSDASCLADASTVNGRTAIVCAYHMRGTDLNSSFRLRSSKYGFDNFDAVH